MPACSSLAASPNPPRHRYRMGVKAGLDEKIVTAAPTGHTVKGVSTLYGADGSIAAQWVKTRSDEPSLEDITEAVRAAFDGYQGKSPLVPAPEQTDRHCYRRPLG